MSDFDDQKTGVKFAESFLELVVYQKARVLSREVFEISKRLPKEEAFSLTDQWRRASRSIGAQIAEAWGKRHYPKHFASKLTDAQSEQLETQHWIVTALDCSYITREEAQSLGTLCKEVGKMLASMIRKTESFTAESPTVRETPSWNEDETTY